MNGEVLDLLMHGLGAFWTTYSGLKTAFVNAIITNGVVAFTHLLSGNIYWLLAFVGTLILAWRLKTWFIGVFVRAIFK